MKNNMAADPREQRMQQTPAYKKAMKRKSDKNDSAVHKAQTRTFEAMGEFFQEVARRHQTEGLNGKIFQDTSVLTQQCNDFLQYCMEHELVPSWTLLSVWLGCNIDTLYAITNLGDKRAEVLQKAKSAIYTILEQFTVSAEGNPGGRIFLMKSLWGLSDQQPVDINIHTDSQQAALSPDKIENIVELAPNDYKDNQ